jgi:sporulation integral membrane protein YlbJ
LLDLFKKINKFSFSIFVVAFMFYIIKYPQSSSDIVLKGLNICYFVIIPVIFPFLAFSKLFINSSFFGFLGKIFNKPSKFLFGISGEYANALLIGGIAGFPMGAKTVKEIYLRGKSENKNEAERTLAFCNNCSVSFAVSAAGIIVFNSVKIGFYLFFIQLISAIITGIIIKFIFVDKNVGTTAPGRPQNHVIQTNTEKLNIAEMISESVTGILNICGTVLFFYIIANILVEYLNFLPFFSVPTNSQFVKTFISGIFEISSGIYSLVNLNIPEYNKIILSSIILSWSGISVHFQIMHIIKDIKLSLKPYFTGKIIHVIISIVITVFMFKIVKISIILLLLVLTAITGIIVFYLFEKNSKNRKIQYNKKY